MRIEKKGKPTAMFIMSVFTSEAATHSKGLGLPSLPMIPILEPALGGDKTFGELIIGQTEKVVEGIKKVLTTPAEKLQEEYNEKFIRGVS